MGVFNRFPAYHVIVAAAAVINNKNCRVTYSSYYHVMSSKSCHVMSSSGCHVINSSSYQQRSRQGGPPTLETAAYDQHFQNAPQRGNAQLSFALPTYQGCYFDSTISGSCTLRYGTSYRTRAAFSNSVESGRSPAYLSEISTPEC